MRNRTSKKNLLSIYIFINILAGLVYLSGCLNDSGPYYVKPTPAPPQPEPCLCDKTPYRDCWCDTLDPLPCGCNKIPYREPNCSCDTLDPICPCDSTPYMDCYCDNYHPVYNCPCDTTPWRDCHCDTIQPVYNCPCGAATVWWDCECDRDPVYNCPCDVTKYKDCDCDRDTEVKPIEKLSYKKDIQPILNKHCVECHYNGASIPDFSSEDGYNTIISAYINIYAPTASKIYVLMETGEMPPGDVKVTKPELDKIEQWIKDGALE
ncbi:MAG: hypothetical protein SNJ71_08790 [Bacteroidales bacterium]